MIEIRFSTSIRYIILEGFDTSLKICTVALSFSPSHRLQWIFTDAVSIQPSIAPKTGHSWGGNIFETGISICKAGDYGLAPKQQRRKNNPKVNVWKFPMTDMKEICCLEGALSSNILLKRLFAKIWYQMQSDNISIVQIFQQSFSVIPRAAEMVFLQGPTAEMWRWAR